MEEYLIQGWEYVKWIVLAFATISGIGILWYGFLKPLIEDGLIFVIMILFMAGCVGGTCYVVGFVSTTIKGG